MRVLLDTNIVLDYLGANQGFTDDAEKVFDLAVQRNIVFKGNLNQMLEVI